jgi:plastocyanin
MKKTLPTLAAAVSVLALAVPASAANKTVKVGDDYFSPKVVTINKGNTVTWTWLASAGAHNVRFKSFGSAIKSGGSYKRRFTTRGTFAYKCTLHLPEMVGKVIVK